MCYDGSSLELDTLMHWTSRANPEVPMILGGKSSLGCNHSVVVLNGEIVCDPSGNGIVGPMCENLWWITIISMVEPAKLFARRGLA